MLLDSHSPLDTPTLLIDFDHAEVVKDNVDQNNKGDKCHTVVCS